MWGKNAEWFEPEPPDSTDKPSNNDSLVEACSRWILGGLDSTLGAVYSSLLLFITDPSSKLDVFYYYYYYYYYALWGENAEGFERDPATFKPSNTISNSLFERYLGNT